ncbi:hypothetical protein [Mollivirus kamchatka]|nr:hypothetical protein [Mollivirus kamchatka]
MNDSIDMPVVIDPFDFSKAKADRAWAFVGRKGSGKTSGMIYAAMMLYRLFDFAVALSPASQTRDILAMFMPASCIHSDLPDKFLEELIDETGKLTAAGHEVRLLLMMDDLMYDSTVLNTKPAKKLYKMGRHHKITFFNAVQYVRDMAKNSRAQHDYIFAAGDTSPENMDALYEIFFSSKIRNREDFDDLFTMITADYGMMVLDLTSTSDNIQDCIFRYQAPHPNTFHRVAVHIGGRSQWKMHYGFGLNDAKPKEISNPIPGLERKRKREQEALNKINNPEGQDGTAAAAPSATETDDNDFIPTPVTRPTKARRTTRAKPAGTTSGGRRRRTVVTPARKKVFVINKSGVTGASDSSANSAVQATTTNNNNEAPSQ